METSPVQSVHGHRVLVLSDAVKLEQAWRKPQVIKVNQEPDMEAHASQHSRGRSKQSQGQTSLHCKFWASQGCIVKPCLKTLTDPPPKKERKLSG